MHVNTMSIQQYNKNVSSKHQLCSSDISVQGEQHLYRSSPRAFIALHYANVNSVKKNQQLHIDLYSMLEHRINVR